MDDDVRASPRELERDRASDALRGPGHERPSTSQLHRSCEDSERSGAWLRGRSSGARRLPGVRCALVTRSRMKRTRKTDNWSEIIVRQRLEPG